VNPDQNDTVATANIPHVMYYAPNVSDARRLQRPNNSITSLSMGAGPRPRIPF